MVPTLSLLGEIASEKSQRPGEGLVLTASPAPLTRLAHFVRTTFSHVNRVRGAASYDTARSFVSAAGQHAMISSLVTTCPKNWSMLNSVASCWACE